MVVLVQRPEALVQSVRRAGRRLEGAVELDVVDRPGQAAVVGGRTHPGNIHAGPRGDRRGCGPGERAAVRTVTLGDERLDEVGTVRVPLLVQGDAVRDAEG